MRALILFLTIWGLSSSCKEEIKFATESEDSVLVINGYISDLSYNDYANSGFASGRYFSVDVNYSRDIHTFFDSPATDANVTLISSAGDTVMYSETDEGHYELYLPQFKAEPNVDYQLQITTREDESFYSDWVKIPEGINQIDQLKYERSSAEIYYYVQGERLSEMVDVLDIQVSVPAQTTTANNYFVWEFDPAWIYEAPLLENGDPLKRCWILDDEYYLNQLVLKNQKAVPFTQSLFTEQLSGNEKLLHDMTVLISQQLISEPYFVFLEELQKQQERGTIFDSPPYNIRSNIHTNGERKTAGFFSVTKEQIERIYLNHDELDYYDEAVYYAICNPCPGCPPPVCVNCLAFEQGGQPVNQKPAWWR